MRIHPIIMKSMSLKPVGLLTTLLLFALLPVTAAAQVGFFAADTSDTLENIDDDPFFDDGSFQADSARVEEDPFKNDPFFNKPFSEFFNNKTNVVEGEDIQNSFASLQKSGLDYGMNIQSGPYQSGILYGVFPVLSMVHFNRVNGLYLGYRQERMQWYDNGFPDIPNVNFHGSIGRSFGRDEWSYSVGMDVTPFGQQRFMIGGEYHQNSITTDDYWRTGLTENSLTSLFAAYDYMDYYQVDGVGVYTLMRGERLFEIGAAYLVDVYSNVQRNTQYSFFGNKSTYRKNPLVSEGDFQSLYLAGSFNPKELLLTPGMMFRADALIELADMEGMENDYTYRRYQFETRFSSNFTENSMFEWRFKSGALAGDMPLQRLFELGGIGTLRGREFKAYQGNAMVLNNFQIHFGHPSYNEGEWISWDDLRVSFFVDSGWAHFERELWDSKNPFDGYDQFSLDRMKHDVGIGLGSNILRFEMAWPTDALDEQPVIWFRFNPLLL